ncbi:MAG: helix-turn-helix domain-containing protein [Flavobacteriaceae bacterium]
MSQAVLGGKANLEKAAVQRLERGNTPTLKTLIKVAHALEVPAAALLQFD